MARTDHLVGLVVVAACVTGCADDGSPVVRPVTDPSVRGTLRQVAHGIAKRAGVESPASMVAVAAADHQAAEAVVSGAVIDDHAPVYVVQMTGGTFTAIRHPRGRPVPAGNVLTITFDATTFLVTDVGYDSIAPDLTKIDARTVDLLVP
jgi:hypothetical protein